MGHSGNQARRYFKRLIERERTRAALKRQEAAREPDAARRRSLEAMAEGHDRQMAIYQQRHDEVEP
jgi:ribosomal protein S21